MANEKRLIYLEDAKEALTGWETDPTDGEIEYTLDNLQIVDAVEVVRCKDCKNRGSNLCPMETVELYPWFGSKNDAFCSYGERREGE